MSKVICPKCNGTGKLPDRHAIGCQFKRKRQKKGYTLSKVSNLTGISRAQLCKLENGQKEWRQDHIDAYKKALK